MASLMSDRPNATRIVLASSVTAPFDETIPSINNWETAFALSVVSEETVPPRRTLLPVIDSAALVCTLPLFTSAPPDVRASAPSLEIKPVLDRLPPASIARLSELKIVDGPVRIRSFVLPSFKAPRDPMVPLALSDPVFSERVPSEVMLPPRLAIPAICPVKFWPD